MPWVHNAPDFNLVETVENWPIKPCKTLEMGCGTGVDAIWLASQHFDVTACDASEIAIDTALKNHTEGYDNCRFHLLDCLHDTIPGAPFGFIFDRGYFHSYKTQKGRKEVVGRIAELLETNGLWLSISGSADGPERETGPPRLSATQIMKAVENHFRVLSFQASHFGNEESNPAHAWIFLLRKR